MGLTFLAPTIINVFGSTTAQGEERRRTKPAVNAGPEMVDINDPTAKAVGYVEVARKSTKSAGNKCSTCVLFTKPQKNNGKEIGECTLFPKKFVTADGFCNSWAKKA